MEILKFIKDYWALIVFFGGLISSYIIQQRENKEATKCSLRNDILSIYDQCKDKKQITHYQLSALTMSADLYFKLKGNSFVKDIVDRVKDFELVD